MEIILVIVLLIMGRGLLKAIFTALNTSTPNIISNTTKGLENMSDGAPALGAMAGLEAISFANSDVEKLKQQLGCTEDSIITMTQLHKWMKEKNLM